MNEQASQQVRPNWSSQKSFILASVAGVVGLGNLWRFPYMAGENGGGSFVVAYLICVVLIGIPIALLEISFGKHVGRGPVAAFQTIVPKFGKWLGWGLIAITVMIMSYYFVITGWTLGYALNAVGNEFQTFDSFSSGYNSLWLFLVVVVLVALGLMRGIDAIESTSRIMMPLLVVMVVGLAIYSQSLSGAAAGRDFYLTVDWDRLPTTQIWRMAAGQAFYSLSIGLGFLITYGSYAPRQLNVVGSTFAVAFTNSAISIVAGLMVFPIVYTFGIAPDAGSGLSFTAIPALLGDLSSGHIVGIGFFWLLFLAAFTSCFGGMMIPFTALRFEFNLSRVQAALLATTLAGMLGIPSALSFTPAAISLGGEPFLDQIDRFSGSGIVVIAGIVGATLISWKVDKSALSSSMNSRLTWVTSMTVFLGKTLPIWALVGLALTLI